MMGQLAHGLIWIVLMASLAAACRDVRRSSRTLGWICLAGVVSRVAGAIVLYWISANNVAAFSQWHTGDGFWQLAPDARSYYRDARIAAIDGLQTVSDWRGSAGFVRILAVWLRVAAIHPLSGVALNTLLYAAVLVMCGRLVRVAPQLARPVTYAAVMLSFAPLLLLHSTQPLKDTVFAVPVLLCTATLVLWISPGTPLAAAWLRRTGLGGGAWIAAFYVVGGIRSYYALLMWCAAVIAVVVCAPRVARRTLPVYLIAAIIVLAGCWIAQDRAAGFGYINPIAGVLAPWSPAVAHFLDSDVADASGAARGGATASLQDGARRLTDARERFETSGGDTNVIVMLTSTHSSPIVTAGQTVAIGLALMFVPISVLKAAHLVDISGGRGLMAVADLDTVFMDVLLALFVGALIRERQFLRRYPAVCAYAVTLSAMTYLLMAFVVSNYGTLVRLRMMAAFPLMGLPLAILFDRVATEPAPPPGTAAPKLA